MDRDLYVYLDLNGLPQLVGRLWSRLKKGRESATFEYDKSWLAHPRRFSLEPALTVGPGSFHTTATEPMFSALSDSAPDRWGRVLMRREERRRATAAIEEPRTLREIDFLILVDDEARQGALRFAESEGGPFLTQYGPNKIPPLIALPRLLSASEHVVDETESDEDLKLLLAPGSSLGGARPKASVIDRGGVLSLAKFPSKDDPGSTVLWEAVALTLAKGAGITVPDWRLETVGKKPVLLLRRFDRDKRRRIPFLSAMTMLGAKDNETRSYLEFIEVLRLHGAAPKADIQAVWRRIVFNILISNTDDHLRNHGFLWTNETGWRLSPAYDLNPVPPEIKPRVLSTNINEHDGTASIDLAMDVAQAFELKKTEALGIVEEVGKSVSQWRKVADKLGISASEIGRMEPAIEHSELRAAMSSVAKPRRGRRR